MMFGPTLSAIAPEALPDVTDAPLTLIVALGCILVAVIVVVSTEFATETV
jgi:hypothetical protein